MRITKAEKRVELAKDVLKQLRAKKFAATSRHYCRTQEVEEEQVCEVCGIGALAVACCGPEPDMSLSEALSCLKGTFPKKQLELIEAAFECVLLPPSAYTGWEEGVKRTASLKSLKAASEMYMPKRVEFDSASFGSASYKKLCEKDEKWEDRFRRTTETRLRKIMKNIIDNNGTFVVGG